jgi:asparaginyl-tRNA synthetase
METKIKRSEITALLQQQPVGTQVNVKGWVRSIRNDQFVIINDGSCFSNLQCVVDFTKFGAELLKRTTNGAAVSVTGKLVASQGKGQAIEVIAGQYEILGDCDHDSYPLQLKNRPSLDYLREKAHMRFRTNTFGAVFRLRHALGYAIHDYFHKNGFYYFHAPILTASDAEGAGEMFTVTTLPLANVPKTPEGKVDFKEDFFGKDTKLTVSGQLEAELAAMALGKVYTFGPTFRAENSNTTRHLAEFWMIEPEVAFNDLNDNMDLAESLLKYVIKYVLDNCAEDLAFLDGRLTEEEKQKPQNERSPMPLIEKLKFCVDNEFVRLTYTEAIDILMKSKPNKEKKFQFPVNGFGTDLQSEHERYLVEKHFKKPVILTDYPKEIKAFYMRQNDDGTTVRAMDILFPGIGEMVGGSQREERLDKLEQRMKEMHIPTEEMYWYLDTRRFGTAQHAGFGLGFERLVLFCTGMTNIRDVIPFARTPKNCEF